MNEMSMNETEGALNLNDNPCNPVNKTKTTIKRIYSRKMGSQCNIQDNVFVCIV